MESSSANSNSSNPSKSALFNVYLRLRPSSSNTNTNTNTTTISSSSSNSTGDRFLSVEEQPPPPPNSGGRETHPHASPPTHITLNPPTDKNNRRRAVEKFAFTTVFEEGCGQLEVFEGVGVGGLVEGVLGGGGGGGGRGEGRDGLLATLGVTGSGKTHTILGSRTQRGLTQLSLDVLFRSIEGQILDPSTSTSLHATVAASDPSEAQVMSAQMFIDSMFADPTTSSRANSRAPTPMVVGGDSVRLHSFTQEPFHLTSFELYPQMDASRLEMEARKSIRVVASNQSQELERNIQVPGAYLESYRSSIARVSNAATFPSKIPLSPAKVFSSLPSYMSGTLSKARKCVTKSPAKLNIDEQGESYPPPTPRRNLLTRPSALPLSPDISNVVVDADPNAEYSVLISMYEVYNDRIFDLLTPALPNKGTKDFRRRPLLFKSTEQSPDRKVVAGLRKIICSTTREALMVLEAGLHERRVAGTGSNSVSSRSHGFFCVEVKKRRRGGRGLWGGNALTIVDLAGSERARDAKTQGATLQEAGKINESLMYLGQCLQMQSDLGCSTKPNLVPFRQCKLTELLFSNSFPSASSAPTQHRIPQKATMIVTADPHGDFNATSQILRYSALAREITVPRIPSVTSTILAASTASHYFNPARVGSGRHSPTDTERETMEIAALEIARMSEEIDGLRAELLVEQDKRLELDARLESLAEREVEIEADVREQCYQEMEARFTLEMDRWKARWLEEQDNNEAHMDRKLDILARMSGDDVAAEDEEDKENRPRPRAGGEVAELQGENERLRREVELLRREIQGRSPSKNVPSATRKERLPLRESKLLGVQQSLESLRIDPSAPRSPRKSATTGERGSGSGGAGSTTTTSPKKAVRKLAGRKWDLGEDEIF